MRILLSVLLLLFLLPSWSGEERLPVLHADAPVTARRVALNPTDPNQVELGGLTYLGGLEFRSSAPGFGGFSAMAVLGDRFTLLSDSGTLMTFRMDASMAPQGIRFSALPDGPGTGWSKLDRDSESLTRDPATGSWWVGFERANAIWRYSPDFTRATGHVAPPAMADWPSGSGPETMVRLRDGRFLVIAEGEEGARKGTKEGLDFTTDPVRAPRRGFVFSYRPPRGYRPVDIAELPDGRLAILNRRFALRTLFTAALTIVPRAAIRPGAIVRGREIARFTAPILHDNFEAIAVTREGKDTILWIASDDNQQFWERSLLLKFRLDV
ncbi:esterase-like activity of phytase family protein [Sphingomonas sp.]|uniref:esterase-like activity of phytase family protein n=1 Tax=Sphingomonas sp. TaxID=28214 RepID=UPI001EC73C5A|nr:esterase-like activity of phytase family protein [Sphingomonas sp.]MBX3593436.1 esterase-like activity of phytase family protein [Sphingomonas sp.]